MSNKGFFITLEGIDGSGKSTQVQILATKLKELGIDNVVTREPGGTEKGERIRTIILSSSLSPEKELELFVESRKELNEKVIKPALSEGKWVLCDRYIDSSFAYQVFAKGVSIDLFVSIHKKFGIVSPDITFVLDIDPEVAVKRISKGGKFHNLGFLKKVRDGYRMLDCCCWGLGRREIVYIDADRKKVEISGDILKKVYKLCGIKNY